jgi:glucokinase
MPSKYIITIDLGATKILSALIDSKNQIIERVKLPTEAEKGRNYIIKNIVESVEQLKIAKGINDKDIKAICLGVPGIVNPNTGIIELAPNLKLKKFNIKAELKKYFSIPVLIENDVNLAGLGIKKYELKDKIENMIIVFIGTGIGGALFFDGKLYRGSSFFAGEIGHIKVNKKGELSGSRLESTFELVASRTAIVTGIRKDLKKKKKGALKGYTSNKKLIKSKLLQGALKNGDPVVVKQVKNACEAIGTVLGSVTTLLNIDTIVLGGGVIEAMGGFMLPKIKDSFKLSVLKGLDKNVKIFATKLGDDAPLYGGIALAEEFLKSK